MKILFTILCFTFFSAEAQFGNGSFTDKKTKITYRFVTVNNLDWMQDDVAVALPDTADVITVGQRFVKRSAIEKFCPKGWRLPTLQEVRSLIDVLDGEKNKTGGKTVDSTYLQTIFPFTLSGFYYSTANRIVGEGFMTAYYTATDTLRSFDTTGVKKQAQVAIHIYTAGPGKINIEPTFSKVPIYCRLRFVRSAARKE